MWRGCGSVVSVIRYTEDKADVKIMYGAREEGVVSCLSGCGIDRGISAM